MDSPIVHLQDSNGKWIAPAFINMHNNSYAHVHTLHTPPSSISFQTLPKTDSKFKPRVGFVVLGDRGNPLTCANFVSVTRVHDGTDYNLVVDYASANREIDLSCSTPFPSSDAWSSVKVELAPVATGSSRIYINGAPAPVAYTSGCDATDIAAGLPSTYNVIILNGPGVGLEELTTMYLAGLEIC